MVLLVRRVVAPNGSTCRRHQHCGTFCRNRLESEDMLPGNEAKLRQLAPTEHYVFLFLRYRAVTSRLVAGLKPENNA